MNGEDVPLADLGMGSIQIILLLLKLATLIEDGGLYPGLVIIEQCYIIRMPIFIQEKSINLQKLR